MSFHKAGQRLSDHEVALAKLDVEHKRAETEFMKATAAEKRADAQRLLIEEGGVDIPGKFGSSKHERTIIGAGPA
jgi:hypothetical protein